MRDGARMIRHRSGLWLPDDATARSKAVGREPAPPGPPRPIDRVKTFADERSLGLAVSSRDDVERRVGQLPFEASMRMISRLAVSLWPIRYDAAAQLELLRGVFSERIHARLRRFVAEHPAGRIVLGEQHLFTLQRLVVAHAHDDARELTEIDVGMLLACLLGVTSLIGDPDVSGQPVATDDEHMLAVLTQSGAYNADPDAFNTFPRAFTVLGDIARRPELRAHPRFCALDDWARDHAGLTIDEQLTVALAATVSSAILADGQPAPTAGTLPPEFVEDLCGRTGMSDRREAVADLLAADRATLRGEFAALGGEPVSVAWERRPWMRHPFVRMSDGRLVLSSPRALLAWGTDGLYYRLLDAARARDEVPRFTSFFGTLIERYALELAELAFAPGDATDRRVRVLGEQAYGRGGGQRTSDIAIDLGEDLVLIEVGSGRLTAAALTSGAPEQVQLDLVKTVVKKARQLDRCVTALLDGRAALPGVNIAAIKRIWPVVVCADPVLPNPIFWQFVDDQLAGALGQDRVEPLVVLDFDDLEDVLGHVEGGVGLADLLGKLAHGPYARHGFRGWMHDDPTSPPTRRLTVLHARWQTLAVETARRLGDPELARRERGDAT